MTFPPLAWARRILHQRRWRYVLAGGVNTLVGLSVYPILWFLLHPMAVNYLVILAIAQVVSVSFAFLTTKFYVFRTRGNHLKEAWKFASFHLLYFVADVVALRLLVENLHIAPIIAQTGISLVALVGGYVWHNRITFKHQVMEKPPL
jgi:putative flippase GtrA